MVSVASRFREICGQNSSMSARRTNLDCVLNSGRLLQAVAGVEYSVQSVDLRSLGLPRRPLARSEDSSFLGHMVLVFIIILFSREHLL